MTDITPEQARNLPYDNYTTPWALIEDVVFDGRGDYEQAWHAGPATVYDEDLVPLVAAAPIMAAQIAEMQWEYGVEQHTLDNPHWHTAIPYDRGFDQDRCTQLAETFRANNPHNKYRVVRRLVGEPEVID